MKMDTLQNRTEEIVGYYPTGCKTKSIFCGIMIAWIQSFPSLRLVALPRLEKPYWSTIYLFMPIPRALTRSETRTSSSKIWSRNADSIFCEITVTLNVPPDHKISGMNLADHCNWVRFSLGALYFWPGATTKPNLENDLSKNGIPFSRKVFSIM